MNPTLKPKTKPLVNSIGSERQRKTAVVHPFGVNRQRSHLNNLKKVCRDDNFSSLPPEIEANRGTTSKLRKTKSSYISSNKDNGVKEKSREELKPLVLTKPLLDHIDEICRGAEVNCDRKAISQEQRRKSLSKERNIGIKEFYQYSPLWREVKNFLSHKKDLFPIQICKQNVFLQCNSKFPSLGVVRLGIVHSNCSHLTKGILTKESASSDLLWYGFLSM